MVKCTLLPFIFNLSTANVFEFVNYERKDDGDTRRVSIVKCA